MYLKELEIFGFKSFPEKTSLKFESGTTVVVGPNGCGKSNVFDSIKWSLGEQSPKSLRGTKMEDIIFNGTEKIPPLNYAEVGLTFCNEDGYLPIDYKEVSVARRLYRSGESQYFINKNVVRLKDVQELFMGTGIGESTYSFVEQGKIEIFLSYKPEDKRLIFDEASGIVKYKERKKETLKKLEEAEENLLRLEDILTEVRRQIRYLERQVEKANKFKEVQEELIGVEKKIAALSLSDLGTKINKLLEELNVFKDKEKDKEDQLKEVNNTLSQKDEQLRQLRTALEELTTTIVSLSAQIQNSTNHITVNKQRIDELGQRNANLDLAKVNLTQRLLQQKERNQEELKRLETIEEGFSELDTQVENLGNEKEVLLKKIDEAKKRSSENKTKILDLETKNTQLHNTLIEIQTKLTSLINRKKRLLLDKAKLETLLGENKEKLQRAQQEFLITERNLTVLEDKRKDLNLKAEELASLSEKIRLDIFDKEKELLELNTSYEFLKDLSSKYETFSVNKKITVVFDEEPKNINKLVASLKGIEFKLGPQGWQAQIEAKVVSFDEKQLEEKIEITQSQISQLKDRLKDLEQEKKDLTQSLLTENAQIEDERTKLQQSLQARNSLTRESERLTEEFELLTQEETTTVDDINDCEAKQSQIKEDLAVIEEQLSITNSDLGNCQQTIGESSERIQQIDIEVTRCHAQKQSLDKERQTLNSKIKFFEEEINTINGNLEQIDKESQQNCLRLEALNSEIVELEAKIGQDKITIQDYNRKKQESESQELLLNKEIDEQRNVVHVLEKEAQEVRASTYNKKLEIQSLEYEKQKIKDYLIQVYNIEFDPAAAGEVSESSDILNQEKEKLQKRMKSLGEVNLVAIEEFQELKQREEFLETQKQDLVTSKENLKKAIAKINRTSKELFLETFAKIEVEFKNNFKFLFNGGRANLILLDPENVLESGVEIEVQPPGKKLQNVSLLSGGEKALTAIALIFAIFTVRPSPLCVLDEIDAPLDEANVDRFNHLIKKFSATSQFIIITHNKKTMSNADVLYGVTMQEKGISKLVSVKFAEEAPATP